MKLRDIIVELAKKAGISIHQLEIQCGIASGSIKAWNDHIPSVDKVQRIADFFNMSIDALIGRKEETYSMEEKNLVALFRRASEKDKDVIMHILSEYKKAVLEDSAV